MLPHDPEIDKLALRSVNCGWIRKLIDINRHISLRKSRALLKVYHCLYLPNYIMKNIWVKLTIVAIDLSRTKAELYWKQEYKLRESVKSGSYLSIKLVGWHQWNIWIICSFNFVIWNMMIPFKSVNRVSHKSESNSSKRIKYNYDYKLGSKILCSWTDLSKTHF